MFYVTLQKIMKKIKNNVTNFMIWSRMNMMTN